MRNWHSLYDILTFPISLLFLGFGLLGVYNVLLNPAFSSLYVIHNAVIIMIGQACYRLGGFIVVNFPFIFLLRLVSRKGGSATTVLSATLGYFAFVIMTMYFSKQGLNATTYSSIFGLSATITGSVTSQTKTLYPLQTGLVATFFVALSTLISFQQSRSRSEYSFFSFLTKDTACVIRTVIYSSVAGILVAVAWPYFLDVLGAAIQFISKDTTNPVNLMFYGILDRILSLLNLGALVRTPFWYGTNGGTWVDLVGNNFAGDVNIWTRQIATTAVSGISGRFITPYYVLNIFAIPGMLWAMFSLKTDMLERRRSIPYFVLATILSIFSGSLLPLELTLLFLAPLLLGFHLLATGLLFAGLHAFKVYLGYYYQGTNVVAVLPGTLLELLSYLRFSTYQKTIITLVIVGVVTFALYFLFTRFYFRHLSLDLFNVGDYDRTIQRTIASVGGIDNIRLVHSNSERIVIGLSDPTLLDMNQIRKLGAVRIYETKAGYAISFGASSTMIRMGIEKRMKENIRTTK